MWLNLAFRLISPCYEREAVNRWWKIYMDWMIEWKRSQLKRTEEKNGKTTQPWDSSNSRCHHFSLRDFCCLDIISKSLLVYTKLTLDGKIKLRISCMFMETRKYFLNSKTFWYNFMNIPEHLDLLLREKLKFFFD